MLEPSDCLLRKMFRRRRDRQNMAGVSILPAAVEYKLRVFP
jgi:hypothetical protein